MMKCFNIFHLLQPHTLSIIPVINKIYKGPCISLQKKLTRKKKILQMQTYRPEVEKVLNPILSLIKLDFRHGTKDKQ